jgi:hypothetical protein
MTLSKERALQFKAQIQRMIIKKEDLFLKLDTLSNSKLVMFYVALCLDKEEPRRLNYVEEKIQNLNGDLLKLLFSLF